MSKYIHTATIGSFSLTDTEWEKFKKDILSNCHFQISLAIEVTKVRKISTSCLPFRYYDKGKMRCYHISNDDRRKIVSYLEAVGQISRY